MVSAISVEPPQVMCSPNVRRAHDVDAARVDNDKLCALKQPLFHSASETGRLYRTKSNCATGRSIVDGSFRIHPQANVIDVSRNNCSLRSRQEWTGLLPNGSFGEYQNSRTTLQISSRRERVGLGCRLLCHTKTRRSVTSRTKHATAATTTTVPNLRSIYSTLQSPSHKKQ